MKAAEYTKLTATQIARMVAAKQVSAREVAQAACDQVEAANPKLNALLHFDRADVLRRADKANAAGPLAGVPLLVKDNIQVAGLPLTCGSKILAKYRSPYTATAVERLEAAGAVVLGKANLDEFAMGSSCEYSAFGPTRNPWDLKRVPGGSSGGSAASVAARMAPISLGSDTGGSIRQPAAFCGLVGNKPTYGCVSRYGLVAFGSSLDQIGPFTRTVGDNRLALSVMSGPDGYDSTALETSPFGGTASAPVSAKGLRVGYMPEHFAQGLEPEVAAKCNALIEGLRAAGATIVEVSAPLAAYSVHLYYILASSEASSNLSRFDGVRFGLREESGNLSELYHRTRGAGFGAEVKRRIMLGTYALSAGYQDAYYKKALAGREELRREFEAAFTQCDLIIGPTTATPAFELGANTNDPLAMYLCDIYTIAADLTGIPALNIPAGFTGTGLPVGVQLQAAFGRDDWLLAAAQTCETMLAVGDRQPAMA